MSGLVPQMSLTAILAFFAVPAVGYWFVWLASQGRLVRCPEGGAIALVEFGPLHEMAPSCRVRAAVLRCDLWPRRRECARGCAAHDARVFAP